MRKIERIEPAVPQIRRKKRVAAYARVSMETDRLNHSLSAQVSYYSNLIQKDPEWEYAGVYADSFISGTSTKNRTEFQRLIAECEAGQIDIILTKSISRFARNTVDLLETVRHLKSIGVEVRFEKENIHSLKADGEVMLSILASFAQEESVSISNNVKWGTRKRFEQGIPNGHFRVYGYRWEGDALVPIPEEAEIVRRIFQNFLDGKSRLETEREFAAEGIVTRNGFRWMDSNIKSVLTNSTYTGNLTLQKYFAESPLTHRQKRNRGELPQYVVADTHEAIIDKETFDYVQKEMARRKALGPFANKSLNTCCFTGKIKCGKCGKSYMHNSRKRKGQPDFWACGTKKRKGSVCRNHDIPQIALEHECAAVLGLDTFDEDAFLGKVEKIVIPDRNVMVFHMKDGRTIRREWRSTAKRDVWTPERKSLWSAYNRSGGRKGTGMGFNDYIAWKEGNGKCKKQ